MSEGEIVHIEFSVDNLENTGKFYADLFDWKIKSWQGMDYYTFEPKDGPGGGFSPIDGETYKPGTVIVYLYTSDLEGTLEKIVTAGGKVAVMRQEIDGQGWFALFHDPAGNLLGLFTNNPPSA